MSDSIEARRKALGFSVATASDMSNVPKGSVVAIERGNKVRGGDDVKDRYLNWLCAAEERASTSGQPKWLKFDAKTQRATPVLGDDDKPLPGEFTKCSGRVHVYLEPYGEIAGAVAGFKPGQRFLALGESGSFVFQRLEYNVVTKHASVLCFGGTGKQSSFRAFALDRVK